MAPGNEPLGRPHVVRSFTLRGLVKNRARSIVTIVGIALSCALLTAVLLCVGSLTSYLRDSEVAREGSWIADVATTDGAAVDAARADGRVSALSDLVYVGQLPSYSADEDPADAVAGQLGVQAVDSSLLDVCTLPLTEGRLPQNSHEVVLPDAYKGTSELTEGPCELGSTVSGELSLRRLQDGSGASLDPACAVGSLGPEELVGSGVEADYTVVGFYSSQVLSSLTWNSRNTAVLVSGELVPTSDASEDMVAQIPGTSAAYTFADDGLRTAREAAGEPDAHAVYLSTQGVSTAGELSSLIESLFGDSAQFVTHDALMRYEFMTSDRAIWQTLYGLAGVVCAVIVVASASLIFNAFAISVAERTRQFGLLSSIGASRRQIRSMVLWEAAALGAVGIPCGLLLGVAGSAVVLGAISGQLTSLLFGGEGAQFRLVVSAPALAAAAVLAAVVVLLSAWVPSRRAAAVSAVDALRNVSDVRLTPRQLRRVRAAGDEPLKPRGLELGGRLLGVPGTLAQRCATRGPAKHRVACASLAMAVVLFVTAGAFGQALDSIAGAAAYVYDCDVNASAYDSGNADLGIDDAEDTYRKLCGVEGVTGTGSYVEATLPAAMPASMAGPDAYGYTDDEGKFQFQARVVLLDDDAWRAYLAKLGLDAASYTDAEHPRALAYNGGYASNGTKYVVQSTYAGAGTVELLSYDGPAEGAGDELSSAYESYEPTSDGRGVWGVYASQPDDTTSDDPGEMVLTRAADAEPFASVEVGAVVDDEPDGMTLQGNSCVILPLSAGKALFSEHPFSEAVLEPGWFSLECFFDAADPEDAVTQMYGALDKSGFGGYSVWNPAADNQSQRDLVLVLNTFSYSFAVILALVAVTNVINTLVSGLLLRRREFAVLQSVGMGRRGVARMVAWECVRVGARGLLWGLAVSCAVVWLIGMAMAPSFEGVTFGMPWGSAAIAAGVCVLVSAAASAYGLHKASAGNVVEALRMQ